MDVVEPVLIAAGTLALGGILAGLAVWMDRIDERRYRKLLGKINSD